MMKYIYQYYNNLLYCFFVKLQRTIMEVYNYQVKKLSIYVLLVSFFVLLNISPSYAQENTGLFGELIAKGVEIFNGMRDIIYIVSGLGIIAVSIGGFFGNLNWKWLSAIIIGLMVIGLTGGIITFLTGQSPEGISDTLK